MKKLNMKSKPRRTFLVIAIMLAMSICLSRVHANAAGRDRVLTVMARNMDTGADFGPIISATTPLQLLTAVGGAYAEVQASNIPERAAGIAKKIEGNQPGLLGIQEEATAQKRPLWGPAPTFIF